MENVHELPVESVYAALGTSPAGLSLEEAALRLRHYGPNRLAEGKGQPLYLKLLANFTHLMALLLWLGGLIAIAAGLPELAVAVWLVILINGLFSFWQEYKAERASEALRKLLPTYAHVLRDGVECRVVAEELVPGDVLLLAEGDAISADGRLVQVFELRIDQSTLSGESHPARKSAEPVQGLQLARAELPNLVFAGTSVAAGTGRAVVFATGMQTAFGQIASMTQAMGQDLSPLQKEIQVLTKTLSVFAVVVGVLFFVISVFFTPMGLAASFIFALGMIVAFVPEGLLPTVTLALAMGVQRMVKRNALVKRLSSVESLGCTTVICTDKTGTLTQNAMTVRDIWVAGTRIRVTGAGYEPVGAFCPEQDAAPADRALHDLLVAASLCNNARVLPPESGREHWSVLGDPTEAALQVAALKLGLAQDDLKAALPRVRELPFESRRKRMSTIHRVHAGRQQVSGMPMAPEPFCAGEERGAGLLMFVKGAPKETLDLCTQVQLEGAVLPLTNDLRASIMAANDEMAAGGLRVLAVAWRWLSADWADFAPEQVECDLTLLGLIGMMDPPRDEVKRAVEMCHQAGIRVIMITGDYGLTAESIARRIGIVSTQLPRIVTGVELDNMDESALQHALREEVIFARAAPEHKLRIVSTLQAMGEVVAVTGDGVNDAPALKKADIGVAMGVTGTDVAKEAADMVLTDDNFASIVNAVEEGRAVYANIRKFTSYILTSNTPEAVPFILFALSGGRIPLALNIMQILAVDLGTDIVPALALGAEEPEPGVMARPPRRPDEHIITRSMLARAYLWLGSVQSLAAMAAFYFLYWTQGYWGQWLDLPATGWIYHAAAAMALGAVVATQVGNLFAHRSESVSAFRFKLLSNRLLGLGIVSELVLFSILLYVPFLRSAFGMEPFPLPDWLFLLAWMPALLLVDEARKALRRLRLPSSHDGRPALHHRGGEI
ncbi:MAG: cation-transporting P-type ATPase [Caldilineaceae bacterium]|nr:cation-transporting P-type ATPase [Caldilineaceae bacterium]